MDYRDNPQHLAPHQPRWSSFAPPQWSVFTPALTDNAQSYIKKLNKRLGLMDKPDRYRLLSESEWEFAARAGTTTKYHFGNTISASQARYNAGRGEGTANVGSYPPNAFGLHDMHGNVWEWVEDCWNFNYSRAPTDGRAWLQGDCSLRVLRGGSWFGNPRNVRAANRDWDLTVLRDGGGFRVARTLPR